MPRHAAARDERAELVAARPQTPRRAGASDRLDDGTFPSWAISSRSWKEERGRRGLGSGGLFEGERSFQVGLARLAMGGRTCAPSVDGGNTPDQPSEHLGFSSLETPENSDDDEVTSRKSSAMTSSSAYAGEAEYSSSDQAAAPFETLSL